MRPISRRPSSACAKASTISVEDAIKGLVTRSANDAAVVVAENLAGSEEEFARQMTRKARALGMTNTTYRNASGLPDSAQVTTARDQATLGRAIQERFPRYYKYFSTRSFTFRGQRIGNHNRLLGSVEGVDGIKTGYIRASGFNLVTSVKRKGRHVVAVVLGGTSAGARDARMRQLLAQHVDSASTRKHRADDRRSAGARHAGAARGRSDGAETGGADRFEMASAATAGAHRAARLRSAPPRIRRADPPGRGPHRFGEAARREGRQNRTDRGSPTAAPHPPLRPRRSRSRRCRPPPASKHRRQSPRRPGPLAAPVSSACCRRRRAPPP